MKASTDKVHIHRVVQQRLEEQGQKGYMDNVSLYDKIRATYDKVIDEKGMIPISALADARYN